MTSDMDTIQSSRSLEPGMALDMLSSLPVELLTMMVAHLEWTDHAACRLTCRRIEAAMFPSFARNSFTTCRVMRTPESIQTLIDISKSRLGPFVQRLIVSTEVMCALTQASRNSWPSESGLDAVLTADQEAFICSGCDRDMLTEALVNLQSVRSIQILPVFGSAPYSMSTTPRSPSAQQRSLGLRQILLEREKITEPDSKKDRPTRAGDVHSDRACVHSTLLALGKATSHLREMDLVVKGGFNCEALHIPTFIAPSAMPVLVRVERLTLNVTPSRSLVPVRGSILPQTKSRMTSTHGLRVFLQYTTQLRNLSLSLNRLRNKDDGFVEWLAAVPSPEAPTRAVLPQSPPAITLSCLRKLLLDSVYGVRVQSLLLVVRKFAPTLQELHFSRLRLGTSSQDQVPTSRAPGDLWTEFLKSIDTKLMNELHYLSLKNVKETIYFDFANRTHRISWDTKFAKGQGRFESCAYSGPAMRHALDGMAHYLRGDSAWTPPTGEGKWRFE